MDTLRKLVTVQAIEELSPIENADLIEKARVLGWNIVVQKGLYSVGDLAAYFEVDSFLPEENPIFQEFQPRGQKTVPVDGQDVTGHVLRTIKLRGVISQGLLMPLGALGLSPYELSSLEVGDDLTDLLGVFKYEPPLPTGTNIIGPFDTRFAPKTDALRGQTLAHLWDELKALPWVPTVKIDGTSQTLVNDGGTYRIFGRNWELDAASAAGMAVAKKWGLLEELEPGDALQFELAGEGIQKNRLKLTGQRPFVFAVWRKGEKLPRAQWSEKLLAAAAPELGPEWRLEGTLDEMLAKVSTLRGSITKDVLDEGIVFTLGEAAEVPEELGRNANFKLISNRWLLKFED
jgi:RNA ligase (TIGR02306 family)